jgi:hypothetical protein
MADIAGRRLDVRFVPKAEVVVVAVAPACTLARFN